MLSGVTFYAENDGIARTVLRSSDTVDAFPDSAYMVKKALWCKIDFDPLQLTVESGDLHVLSFASPANSFHLDNLLDLFGHTNGGART